MKIYRYPSEDQRREIITRPSEQLEEVRSKVAGIIEAVRAGKDEAVVELTKKYDGKEISTEPIDEGVLNAAEAALPLDLRLAIQTAINNVQRFHGVQADAFDSLAGRKIETVEGVKCWRLLRPIERVGLYIPAGSAPLFSTLIMLGVPAALAGCPEIVVVTPPSGSDDWPADPIVLGTASLLGIKKVYPIGGAQAIASLAFGLKHLAPVDKICGPGNAYVDIAKQLISVHAHCRVSTDLPAGPSEVCIIADASSRADFVAADLLAQAEHGPDSQVLLITDSDRLIASVSDELKRQLEALPRRIVCEQSLASSKMVLVRSIDEAIELSNAYAPEHLILSVENAEACLDKVRSAGSVFVGELSAESFGDYASGTNHVLPTSGWARSAGGVSVATFQRWISVQMLNDAGVRTLADPVAVMARAEGLEGHARSVEIRKGKGGGYV